MIFKLKIPALIVTLCVLSGTMFAATSVDPASYGIQSVDVRNCAVNCIAFSADMAWIGTDLGILSSALSQPAITQQLNSANVGLPSDRVTALAVKGEDIWVGTDSGLAVISFMEPKPADPVKFFPYEDPPQVIGTIRPVYPDAAKRANVQGTVVLEVEVFSDGSVGLITVKRSIKELDEAAVDAVKKVKFKPGKLSGEAINTTVIIPIEFRLN